MATDDENLARLTIVRSELEAEIIIAALADEGIKAAMSADHTSTLWTLAPGLAEVLVAEDNLSQAQAILQQVRNKHSDVDWSNVDVGEPEDE
jgi:hypothetical protein